MLFVSFKTKTTTHTILRCLSLSTTPILRCLCLSKRRQQHCAGCVSKLGFRQVFRPPKKERVPSQSEKTTKEYSDAKPSPAERRSTNSTGGTRTTSKKQHYAKKSLESSKELKMPSCTRIQERKRGSPKVRSSLNNGISPNLPYNFTLACTLLVLGLTEEERVPFGIDYTVDKF